MSVFAAFAVLIILAQEPLHEAEPIFAPVPMHAHGSSIVETPEGDLLAAWFYGKAEKSDDTLIIQGARKNKGESTWSAPFLMADSQDLPDQNPVLFVDPRGTLWLFWIVSQDNTYDSYLVKYLTSTNFEGDGAPVWQWQDVMHVRPKDLDKRLIEDMDTHAQEYADYLATHPKYPTWIEDAKGDVQNKLLQRLGWMTRIHPIMTSGTRIMLPLYSDAFACSLAAFTEDWGKTWTFSEPIITFELGNIQPAFARRANGEIAAFMRDNGMPKKVRTATSKDDGKTWGPVTHLDIPNPGSSVECTVFKNGHWVLVCNDTENGRHLLTAYLSEDEGLTWPVSRKIESFEPDKGSGSYPSLMEASDGSIHCSYSYTRSDVPGSTIKHVQFNEDWIRAGR